MGRWGRALLLVVGLCSSPVLSLPSLSSRGSRDRQPSENRWRGWLQRSELPFLRKSGPLAALRRTGGSQVTAIKEIAVDAPRPPGDVPVNGEVEAPKAKNKLLKREEAPKFFALSFMMFCIIYVFTMTRDTKDTLIVGYCGAEAIAFLKVYGVVPAAMAFMVGYTWAANHLSKRALFYVTIIPFFAFYATFAFLLYPARHTLHIETFAPVPGVTKLPYLMNLFRYWIFSLYYIVSELWGSAGVPLLFWQCANDVTPIDQAKRFYPLFAILGNMAPIVAGQTTAYVTKAIKKTITDEHVAFEQTLKVLTGFMLGAGTIVMGLYWVIMDMARAQRKKDLADKIANGTAPPPVKKDKKAKPSFIESLRILSKSHWLECIAVMVVSYGLTMEFTEIVWKAVVKLAYPSKQDYMEFMGNYSTVVGVMTVLMLLLGSNIIKILGWQVGALATPLLMASLSLPFFIYITFGDVYHSKQSLMRALVIGTVQNVLSKATKYAFFDPTKEMAYIPLDQNAKVKGKAAIDVLGARLGKSGGALAQQGLVMFFGKIMTGAPVLATLFYIVIVGWVTAVKKLSNMFAAKEAEDASKKVD